MRAAAFAILSLVIALSVPPPAARPKIRRHLAALIVSVAVLAGTFTAA